MEIGTLVKVDIPYKLGERRQGERYKVGKIVGIYSNFVLIEFQTKSNETYKECYRDSEVIL